MGKGKGTGKDKGKGRSQKARPPLSPPRYTAERFDATTLDAFFGFRAKSPRPVEVLAQGERV